MSKELKTSMNTAGLTNLAHVGFNSQLQAWNKTAGAYENFNQGNVVAHYLLTANETIPTVYTSDSPDPGVVFFQAYDNIAGTPLSYLASVDAPAYVARVTVLNNVYDIVLTLNGVEITSGVTTPLLTVHKASDGTVLINAKTPTQVVTSSGQYQYTAQTGETVGANTGLFAQVTITHYGVTHTFPANALISR